MVEAEVNVNWKGKDVKVIVGELTFGDVQEIQDRSIDFSEDGKPVVKPGTMKLLTLWKAIKGVEVDGKKIHWSLNDVKNLSPVEANKILEVVMELNNLEEIFRI